MEKNLNLNVDEFSEHFPDAQVRVTQILNFAFMMGVFLFAGVTIFISLGTSADKVPSQQDLDQMKLFSIVNAGMMFSLAVMSFILGALVVKNGFTTVEKKPTAIYEKAKALFNTSFILRIAIMEGGAMFGVVTCFLAGTSGALRQQPLFWLNLFPAGVFVLLMAVSFPNRERVKGWFQSQVMPLFQEKLLHPSLQDNF